MMTRILAAVLLSAIVSGTTCAAEAVRADLDGFSGRIAPLLKKFCHECHGPTDPEGKLSLTGINPDLLSGVHYEEWRLIEEQVQFGDMPPKDAAQPSRAERDTLLAWLRQELLKTQQPTTLTPGGAADEKLLLPQFGNYVDHLALFDQRKTRVTPAPARIWRLRPDIYDSVAPRLSERVNGLANALSQNDGAEFKDFSTAYFLDESSTQQLLANAKLIAGVQLGPQTKDRVFKVLVEESPPSPAAVAAAIETAFRKALGRGPTQEELQRFGAFHTKSTKIGGHRAAAQALLVAVLLQPEFMFRQELGEGQPDQFGRVRLSQSEIAYALSYSLTNQPLNEFVSAANAGKLATADQVATLVRARLQDDSLTYDKNPRVMQFFREYFHYPFATEVFKDKPAGGEHAPEALVADLELTIKDILEQDQRVLYRLLTTRDYYVGVAYGRNNEQGKLVGREDRSRKYHTAFSLPLDWKFSMDRQPLSFSKDERAGVLTHPAWLAAWSGNFENHPVQRGKWVRTHLLGGVVPDVPIGVDARVPEMEHTAFRERLRLATKAAECWRCHRKMDPLGVALERYDHYGRYQRLDAGQAVDASGEIARTPFPELHQPVASPIEMIETLAASPRVEQVFVRHVFRYFLGRNETLGDANTLQDAQRAYRESGGSFNALVTSILSSDSFLYRQAPSVAQAVSQGAR